MTSGVRIWGGGLGEKMGCSWEDEVDGAVSGAAVYERAGDDAEAKIVFKSARPRFGVGDSVFERERSWPPSPVKRSLAEVDPEPG
jgi:hypothetical protein